MTKFYINRWIIQPPSEMGVDVFILDLTNEKVNDSEIAMCIQEQIYGEKVK